MHGAIINAVIITTCKVQNKRSNYNNIHGAIINAVIITTYTVQ